MTLPSKILFFRRRDGDPVVASVQSQLEAFPRFRKEWNSPASTIHAAVPGFSIPPLVVK